MRYLLRATLALALPLIVSLAASAQDAPASTPAAHAAKPKPAQAAPKPQAAKPAPSPAPAPTAAAAAEPAEAPAVDDAPAPKDITRPEAIKRANAFFNASPVMTADFVQIGSDGKRSEGKLHVQRAGRFRFEYAHPATMEVVSDGAQVHVSDRKLNTHDTYLITQTPLKFLLKEKIDLEKDVTVKDVTTDDSGVAIMIEDKVTFGGTSHLKLIFDPKTFKLKQWQLTDPQGYETLISLFNIDQKRVPDRALFKLEKN